MLTVEVLTPQLVEVGALQQLLGGEALQRVEDQQSAEDVAEVRIFAVEELSQAVLRVLLRTWRIWERRIGYKAYSRCFLEASGKVYRSL
jgi:hypothetical protein